MRIGIPLLLSLGTLAAQQPAKPKPYTWTVMTQKEAESTDIVRGILSGDIAELDELEKKGGGYTTLTVTVRETMKGEPKGQLRIRYYAVGKDNKHGNTPDLFELRDLLKKNEAERDMIVFAQRIGRVHYVTDRYHSSFFDPKRKDIISIRKMIQLHRKLRQTPLAPLKDKALEREVVRCIKRFDNGKGVQKKAIDELIALGPAAIPAIVRHMDNRRVLAEAKITLENRAKDRFESHRTYSPKQVIDALSAILQHHVGHHFGLDWSNPNDRDRAHELEGWQVYAHYLDLQRAHEAAQKKSK